MPYNFYFTKFSPSLTVEAAEAGQTLFRAPLTPGVGVWGCNPARNLSCIKEYLLANFIKIGAVVWIPIADIHAHTHIDFYISDFCVYIIFGSFNVKFSAFTSLRRNTLILVFNVLQTYHDVFKHLAHQVCE